MTRIAFISFLVLVSSCCFLLSCQSPNENQNRSPKPGSLIYTTIAKEKSSSGCYPDSGDCSVVRFTYPKFSKVPGQLSDTLNQFLKQSFDGSGSDSLSTDSVMNDFMVQYNQLKREQGGGALPWHIDRRLLVLNQNPKWICLELSELAYTGGAHESRWVQYFTFEKFTGRRLFLNDFFDSTGLKKLVQLGETAFRKSGEIGPNASLEDAGFWFESNVFALNQNFYFDKQGITFQFNEYEVGPYVLGDFKFTITANELVPIMRNGPRVK